MERDIGVSFKKNESPKQQTEHTQAEKIHNNKNCVRREKHMREHTVNSTHTAPHLRL